jgi:hypothetical protein
MFLLGVPCLGSRAVRVGTGGSDVHVALLLIRRVALFEPLGMGGVGSLGWEGGALDCGVPGGSEDRKGRPPETRGER